MLLGKLLRKHNAGDYNKQMMRMLDGYSPVYSQFGTNIYASDVVQQAITCIATEIKKLLPTHVRVMDADVAPVYSKLQKLLDNPNPRMTKSDFLEKIVWVLFMNYNCFIIPFYDWVTRADGVRYKEYTAMYPVIPNNVEFEVDSNERVYIKLWFGNGENYTLPYEDVIHLRKNFSVNEFMGGNKSGNADFCALLKTLKLNEDLLNGISSAVNSSFAVNGIVKFNTMLDGGKTEQALKDLENKLKKSESGFLPLDIKSDFTPLKKEVKLVDADTLKFIDSKILRFFGVPLPILTGDYTPEQYEAFYQKTLEPLIVTISDAFTSTLFTEKERSFGNRIKLYHKDLIFMNMSQINEMVRMLGDSGTIYENEKRVFYGLRPLPELVGVRMQSLNYVNADIAGTYQIGNSNDEGGQNNVDE